MDACSKSSFGTKKSCESIEILGRNVRNATFWLEVNREDVWIRLIQVFLTRNEQTILIASKTSGSES
jgi:hypothetical protein